MYKLHIFGGLSCDPFTPVALKCGVRLQTTFWRENIKVKFGLTGVSLESKIFLIFLRFVARWTVGRGRNPPHGDDHAQPASVQDP